MLLIYNEKDWEVRNLLRDTYLGMWTQFESMERLHELWSLCGAIHSIHHAVSYQFILAHTEERSRSELGGSPAYHLRNALQYLNELEP